MQVCDIAIDNNKKEMTSHGTVDFPVAVYHSVLSKNVLGYTNWHWHEELQFCLVTYGNVSFFVNQTIYHLAAGEGIFINRNELHMAKSETSPDSSYICLDFHDRLIRFFEGSIMGRQYVNPFIEPSELSAIPLYPSCVWHKKILDLIYSIYDKMNVPKYGYEYDISVDIVSIWSLIINNCSSPAKKSSIQTQSTVRLQNILTYVQQHFSENISLKQIAEEVALSSSECCRFFKQTTGETLFSYLRKIRLSHSMEMLRNTEESISAIAYACGFCSTSYYIEVFRKYMGITPLKYRVEGPQVPGVSGSVEPEIPGTNGPNYYKKHKKIKITQKNIDNMHK